MTVSLQALQATVVIKLITAHMKAEGEARRCARPPIHSVSVHFAYMLSSRLERPHCYLLGCGSLTVRTMRPLMSACITVPVTGACISCGSGVKVPLEQISFCSLTVDLVILTYASWTELLPWRVPQAQKLCKSARPPPKLEGLLRHKGII